MSSTQRFFVPSSAIETGGVRFSRDQSHQMATVLRLDIGDSVIALDNSGWQYKVALTRVRGGEAVGTIVSRTLVANEPRTKLTLYPAVIRPQRLEIALQKCTELGVGAFVPVMCERSVAGHGEDFTSNKIDRWQKIIVEAAEQSGRGKLPAIMPVMSFDHACESVRGSSLILWEGERHRSLREAMASFKGSFSVNLFVGPEGGYADREIERARQAGLVPVSIGPRLLRAETAAIAAAAAIFFANDDLGKES